MIIYNNNTQLDEIKNKYSDLINVFLEQNKMLNLISKNDEKFLLEKHIIDSLAIEKFFSKYGYKFKTLADIGTGGGFPAVPIAVQYPELNITGIDSIKKKIEAVHSITKKLNLKNINLICERAENINNMTFDIITSRAVAKISKLVPYTKFLLKNGGYFIIYKSKTADSEIEEAQNIAKKYNLKLIDTINYNLPLEEYYERKLVIYKKII